MKIYVAYNWWGDLIADAFTYKSLMARIRNAGYFEDEVTIGRVTP